MLRLKGMTMSNETLLKLSAVVFAVLWTGLMWLMGERADLVSLAILMPCGALTGALWYWLYGKWFRWYIGRQ